MCEQHLSEEERRHKPRGPGAFVDELVVAMTNSRIYSAGHPRIESALDNLAEGFKHLCEESGGGRVELGAADGFLFFEERPLLGATLSARRLLEPLSRLESGGIGFDPKTSRDDLRTLVTFMSTDCKGAEQFPDANLLLQKDGCETILFLPPYEDAAGRWGEGKLDEEQVKGAGKAIDVEMTLDLNSQLYQDLVFTLQNATITACKGKNLDTNEASGFVESILKQLATDPKPLMSLSRYERYDAFTFGHSIRVSFLALQFARQMTNDPVLLHRIGLAALMHDIGKSWVPFEVLHAAGRLTDEERAEMSRHTIYGGQILLSNPSADPLAVAVAFSHHQNHGGGGYPESIRCSRQSTATMIVKLCDVYEALTAVRPYKPRMSPTRAYRIMMSMEGHFEQSLLRRFISSNGIFPIGSRVRMNNNRIARVEAQTGDLVRPVVVTETTADGETLHAEDVGRVDLSQDPEQKVRVEELLLDAEM